MALICRPLGRQLPKPLRRQINHTPRLAHLARDISLLCLRPPRPLPRLLLLLPRQPKNIRRARVRDLARRRKHLVRGAQVHHLGLGLCLGQLRGGLSGSWRGRGRVGGCAGLGGVGGGLGRGRRGLRGLCVGRLGGRGRAWRAAVGVGGGVDDGAGRGERVRDAGGVGAAHFEWGLCGWGYIFCGRREWMRGFFGNSVGGVCVCVRFARVRRN